MPKKYRRVQTSKIALFLGAGASKAFGYPTTLDFVSNLEKVLGILEKDFFHKILTLPNVSDIEHVLQKLDLLTDVGSDGYVKKMLKEEITPSESQKFLSPFDTFFNSCETLRQTIINELYRQYEFDTNRIEKIIDYYNELCTILNKISNEPELHVFTTNYDSVFENYCDNTNRQIEFTCGFRIDKRNRRQFWHSEWLKNWKFDPDRNEGIRLYKLHGSLDWREMADGRIERVLTEDKVPSRSRTYKRNTLIYPAQKNYATEEPFRRLQRYFEVVLSQHDLCLVIGFSFRDLLINNAFLDFLRGNDKRRLVVVSPNAMKNVEENLGAEEKQLKEQIRYVVGLFGEKATFQFIEEALK